MTATDEVVSGATTEMPAPWWGEEPAPAAAHHKALSLLLPIGVAGLVAALLAAKGRWTGAVLLVVVITAVTIGRIASPAFDRAFARGLDWFGRAVGHLLRWGLLSVVFVLFFVPVAVIEALFHRGSLGRPRGSGDGWIPKVAMGPEGSPKRGFGSEPSRAPGAKRSKLVTAVFVVAVLVVVDLAFGAVLTATRVLPPIDRGDLVGQIEQALQRDMAKPPMNANEWAPQHGRDMAAFELQTNDYIPYIVRGQNEFSSPTVNVTDRERLSYEPEVPAGTEPLKVAFFGGSVMFGVGQRDEHTIPSEFARIAEENGVPVEVHNYGFPAWVTWQEHQYMERLLAEGEEYDLAIFLDGFNEFDVQQTDFNPDPTHHSATILDGLIADFRDERTSPPGALDGFSELAESYRRSSAAWRLYDTITGRTATLPGYDQAVQGTPEEQTEAALDIYGRALTMITDLAEDHGTPVQFFWQPRAAGWDPSITDRLPEQVTDLTHVFDGQQCFYDVVHTDEACAHTMAQAMWDTVAPSLVAPSGATQPPPPAGP